MKPPITSGEQIIPENYDFFQTLGRGSFGLVVKCWKNDTKEFVAVKLPVDDDDTELEALLLEGMMALDMDKCNIVKFLESFDTSLGKAMVFEILDISLSDYFHSVNTLPIRHIRMIVEQMAIALEGLKTIGFIHADIKLNNIMLCDHTRKDFRLKLIDFGLAMHRTDVIQGCFAQLRCYRAPEVSLGLLFNEAIDVWSLGIMMAIMAVGFEIFPNRTEFETLKVIVKLCGQPSDQILNEGSKTDQFFRREGNSWKIMTNEEYTQHHSLSPGQISDFNTEQYSSIEELIQVHVGVKDVEEAEELEGFIDLLSQMLDTNHVNRITPSEILQHPFICNKRYCLESTSEKSETSENPSPLPNASSSTPGVIMVKAATPEKRLSLDEDREDCVSEQRGPEKTSVTPEHVSLVHQKPVTPVAFSSVPQVILVKPATPENTLTLVDDEQEGFSVESDMKVMAVHTVQGESKSSPRVILVKPASPENTVSLVEDDQEGFSVRGPEIPDKTEVGPVSAEPRVIMVKGATPENPVALDEDKKEPLHTLETESKVCSSDTVSEPSTPGVTAEKKKKKNCFRRLFSWMRKNLCCVQAQDPEQ